MPRYRLYRSAVAGATGRVGEALTRQLLLSPLCSEVHAASRHGTRSFEGLSAAESKLRQHSLDLSKSFCGLEASALAGVDVAFCVLGARGGWADAKDVTAVEQDGVVRFAELCAAAGVQHMALLSSAWADRGSRMAFARAQGEAAEEVAKMEAFQRISIFQPSAALDMDGLPFTRPEAPLWASALWRSMPVAAQFMPTRYRPMPLADIVLALRLNAELCDTTSRVEKLGFVDMMQIIGREGDV
eukprot:CAMPEP_0117553612 /NCGR_PEP_ID=MMETSP0784-20121206/50315_1 /TAXON_ID=39447 /ORGANISM="" /LENGTH=242 /DNA_ID=CAMNT_0005350725 /DNA_START=1 /DNA_END=729 /DNA_ORIENTATION=+